MHNNGVTHSTVCDDFEGVFTVLHWLSYMPKVSPPRLPPAPKSPKDLAFSPQLTASACETRLWKNDSFSYKIFSRSCRFLFFFPLKPSFASYLCLKRLWISGVRPPLLMISSQGSLESCFGSDPSFSRLLPHCGAFPFVISVHPSGGLPGEPWCTEIKSPVSPLSSRLPRETCELYLFLRAWLPPGLLPAAGWD